MTQEELQAIYKSCLNKKGDLDEDKFEKAIELQGGARFISFWQDYQYDACHVEEEMIEYMKEQGFVVYNDPECVDVVYNDPECVDDKREMTGWVVFPPNEITGSGPFKQAGVNPSGTIRRSTNK